jgi:hypothetical protein
MAKDFFHTSPQVLAKTFTHEMYAARKKRKDIFKTVCAKKYSAMHKMCVDMGRNSIPKDGA